MKLNRESKLARFYQWSYGERPEWMPYNFCDYFWSLLWAMVVFPITWLSYPFDTYNLNERFWKGVGMWIFLTAIAYYIFLFIEYPYQTAKISGYVVGGIIGFIALVIGGVYCLEKLEHDGETKKPSVLCEAWQIAVEKKNSVKDNYCPKIEWL